MQSAIKFSIIFPTHNRAEYVTHALKSFMELDGLSNISFELVIIANSCSDSTVRDVESLLKDSEFNWSVFEEETPGLSHARNAGILNSSGDIIVFLDDDIKFDQDWLLGLDRSFEPGGFDIIGGKISLWWNKCVEPTWFTLYEKRLLGLNDNGTGLIPGKPNMIFGGNFGFKREILKRVSEFDASFGRVGNKKGAGEEADFVTRAQNKGFSLGYSSFFEIHHLVTPDRIKFSTLLKFSLGAGRAHAAIGQVDIYLKIKKFIKLNILFLRGVFKNYRHAVLVLANRLAELKILR